MKMDEELLFDPCPDCEELEHEVLKSSSGSWTIKCLQCGKVRTVNPPKRVPLIELNTVVSKENKSSNTRIPTPANEIVSVGDEFDLDDHRMIVTSIELDGQQQVKKAEASKIHILFTKVFDTVPLKMSVNEGDTTKSYRTEVNPDAEIPVGLVVEVDGVLLAIKTLKSDQNRTLHKGFLLARNVRRAFCDPAPRRAKPGQVVRTRTRGLAFGEKSKAPSPRTKGPRGQKSRAPKR